MTKAEIIEMLATSRDHARKLNYLFKKPELERFLEAQTDPTNHEEFPVGSYVYCEWADSKGIVLHADKVAGRLDNRYSLVIKVGRNQGYLHTESSAVVRYQG